MGTATLEERYAANLHGVLSCFDRLIVVGTLPGACYAGGMTSYLYAHGIRVFDYPRFAEPLRERIRERAQEVCAATGIEIEHVSKRHIRKEERRACACRARRRTGAGACAVGHGSVPKLQTLARQDQRQDLPACGSGQVPALLLLLLLCY